MNWFNLPTLREPDDVMQHNEVVMVMQYQAGTLAILAEYSPEGWINARRLERIGAAAMREFSETGDVSIPRSKC